MRCNSRSVCQIYGPNELYGTLIANDGPYQWERTVRTVHHKLRSVSVRVYWTWMEGMLGTKKEQNYARTHIMLSFHHSLQMKVPDPKRPWGAKECDKCMDHGCTLSDAHISPPSTVIKDAFDGKRKGRSRTDPQWDRAASKANLTPYRWSWDVGKTPKWC